MLRLVVTKNEVITPIIASCIQYFIYDQKNVIFISDFDPKIVFEFTKDFVKKIKISIKLQQL